MTLPIQELVPSSMNLGIRMEDNGWELRKYSIADYSTLLEGILQKDGR